MPAGFSWGQTKPQPGATINWGHQLASGLKALVLFNEGAGIPRDLVRGRLLTVSGAPAWADERIGTAGKAPTTSDFWTLGPSTAYASLTSGTMVLIRRKTDATNRATGAIGVNDSTTGSRFHTHCPFNDGVVYLDFGGATAPNRVTWSGWTNQGVDYFVFTAGKRGLAIYHQGILRASSTTAVTRTASAGNFTVNNGGAAGADVQNILLAAVYDREWTAGDVALWYGAPYAMISAPTWRIGVLAAHQQQLPMLGVGT